MSARRPDAVPDYLAGYPAELAGQVLDLIERQRLGPWLLQRHPEAHGRRSDRALYDYALELKGQYLRNAEAPSRVAYDARLLDLRRALGTHASVARVHGGRLRSRREIHIAGLFRHGPEAFLRMIVAHELAHLKEKEHGKAFYQLCRHMAPDYHQLEFELRAYLCYLEAGGVPLWGGGD